jgi:hypothetical protein
MIVVEKFKYLKDNILSKWEIKKINSNNLIIQLSNTKVYQNWIDIEKYEPFTHDGDEYDKLVQQCLNKLNFKLRKFKLEKIESNI